MSACHTCSSIISYFLVALFSYFRVSMGVVHSLSFYVLITSNSSPPPPPPPPPPSTLPLPLPLFLFLLLHPPSLSPPPVPSPVSARLAAQRSAQKPSAQCWTKKLKHFREFKSEKLNFLYLIYYVGLCMHMHLCMCVYEKVRARRMFVCMWV